MTRNLDKRVELLFPVEGDANKAKVAYALRSMFRDSVKARWLGSDGVYRRREATPGEAAFRVQEHLFAEAHRAAASARSRTEATFRPEERRRS
jgi:polyphosphate kinase